MSARIVTCLIADADPALVEAVAGVLTEHGLEVVGRAGDGDEALAGIATLRPDVAIVGLRLPLLSGIEVARRVSQLPEAPGVVLYAAHADREQLVEAMDSGARGFVLKESPLADLVRAAELLVEGGTYVDPVLAGAFSASAATGRLSSPSEPERKVLRLLSEGHTHAEIATELSMSVEEVRRHLRDGFGKLGNGGPGRRRPDGPR